jgi:hypothetical protein
MLPALLFSLIFLLPAWWLWRGRLRAWAVVPLVTCFILTVFTLAIKLDDASHRQAINDTEVLLRELRMADLYLVNDFTDTDELLLLTSMSSQALFRTASFIPEKKEAIDSALYLMASWVADRSNLRQWQRNANWDREVYFLAHAGATTSLLNRPSRTSVNIWVSGYSAAGINTFSAARRRISSVRQTTQQRFIPSAYSMSFTAPNTPVQIIRTGLVTSEMNFTMLNPACLVRRSVPPTVVLWSLLQLRPACI